MSTSESDSESFWNEQIINAFRKKPSKGKNIAEKNRLGSIKEALQQGANIDTVDKHGDTALHKAVKKDFHEIVKFLYQKGARTDIVGREGLSVITLAQRLGKNEVIKMLPDPSPQQVATVVFESTGESDYVSVTADNQHPSTSRDNEDVTHQNPQSEDGDIIQVSPTDFDCDIGTLAGFEYQWMQLTYVLQCALKQKNSKFYLATEMIDAQKLDDVVLQYTKNDKTQVGRFFQVKYRMQEESKISAKNLLAAEGYFSAPQHFRYWHEVTKKDLFKNIKERNVILCTNMGIDSRDCLQKNGIKCITETTDPDPLFKLESQRKTKEWKSAWYKFEANRKVNEKLYAAIEETLQCNQLAKLLAEHIHDRKLLSLDIDIFQCYHVALFKHVFDPETEMFRDNFFQNVDLSEEVKEFRKIFLTEYARVTSKQKNGNDLDSEDSTWTDILERFGKGNNFCFGFGESPKFVSDPQLTDVPELSNQFIKLLKEASKRNYVVRIVRKASNEVGAAQPIKVILDNIEKFSGHVLIKHEDVIKFSRGFLAMGRQSSGNIKEFKSIVRKELGTEYDLSSFKFEVEDNVICTERELLTKDEMPSDFVTELRDKITIFLKEFTLAVNQPNIEELYKIIGENMHSITEPFNTGKSTLSGEVLRSRLSHWFVKEHKNSGKKKEYLSYDVSEQMLDDMKCQVNLLVTFRETLAYSERMTAHDVHFQTEMQLVKSFLASDGLSSTSHRILELVASGTTLLTASWAYATLQGKFTRVEDDVILMDVDRLKLPSIFSTVKSAFDSKNHFDLLFVDCGSYNAEDYLEQLWIPLCEIMKKHKSKKIILITQEGKNMRTRFQIGHETHSVSDDNYSFKNLTVDTQKKILQTPVTKFQGHETKISFGDLLGISSSGSIGDFNLKDHEKDLSKIIDSSTLLDLISGGGIEICNDLESLIEKDYYLDRSIHQVVIEKDILKDDEISDLFAISSTNDKDFSGISTKHVRKTTILGANREKEQFEAFCEENKEHNIHWLKEDSGQYIWEKSVGDVKSLAKYRVTRESNERATTNQYGLSIRVGLINNIWLNRYRTTGESDHDTSCLTMSEEELATRDGPVIISDTAGMGKSTMLTRLAWRLKEKQPDALVIKINLQHHVTAFDEAQKKSGNNEGNIDEAIEFLINELLSRETDPARKLIGRMIKNKSNVALIFDGFDEISPDYETLVINLLETFAKHGIRRIFIATRPHTRETLEMKLQILSYEIKPFTRENQEEFLTKYWKDKSSSGQDSEHNINDRIKKYAQAVVVKLGESINDRTSAFTGIPLQTKLVAEIFRNSTLVNIDSCEKFVNSNDDEPNLAGKIDLIYLYQQFVEKKFDIASDKKYLAFGEKFSDVAQNPVVKLQKKHERDRFFETHQKLAVDTLFDKYKVEKFPSLSHHADIAVEQNGIIVKFVEQGRPQFGHRTYAEYFAATFLVDKLKARDLNEDARKIFVADVLLAENYHTMRAFINLLWAKEHAQDDTFGSGFEKIILNEPRGLQNQTILHVAAHEGHDQIIKTFLKYLDKNSEYKQALYNARDDFCNTTVLIAAYSGCLQSLQLLVENELSLTSTCDNVKHPSMDGSDIVNSANANKETPLCVAAARGEFDAVKYLVDKGANINSATKDETTPLHAAARTGGLEIVKYLVDKGANINSSTKDETTPLHAAAWTGELEIVKYLVDKGANINSATKDETTPLHAAAWTGGLEIVKYLVDKGANINSATKNGIMPLHAAARTGGLEIVKYLVDKGANINSSTKNETTPLHAAAWTGELEIVKYLVDKGANINSATKNGIMPLHAAARTGGLEIVKYLVDKGANINSSTKNETTPLHAAAWTGELEIVKYLVDKGANINSAAKNGMTPLHEAAGTGRLEIVRYLVDKGANINSACKDGPTPLHEATWVGELEVVEYVFENEVIFHFEINNWETPLQRAAWTGQLKVVEYLIGKTANNNSATKDGVMSLREDASTDE